MPAGRPPLSDEPKSVRLPILLTPDERTLLNEAAGNAGKPVSTWARDELVRIAEEAKAGQKSVKRPKKKATKKGA